MKKRIYSLPLALIGAAVLYGCSDREQANGGGETVTEHIALSAAHETGSKVAARADGDFPNSGKIAVLASYYGGTPNWSGYTDIDNATATAGTLAGGVYPFTWDSGTKYWPFDGAQLIFMAYSPAAAAGSAVQISADRRTLTLALEENMPDVLYASANATATTTPYSKASAGKVDLGTFRHALSQVTVEVVADKTGGVNSAIEVVDLVLETDKKNATLDIATGALALGADENFRYELISTRQTFYDNGISKTVLVYPGTQAGTKVLITLQDGPFTILREFDIEDFENIVTEQNDLTFRRATNTILRITVRGASVQNPDEQIVLQGQLTEWNERGDFQIIVK